MNCNLTAKLLAGAVALCLFFTGCSSGSKDSVTASQKVLDNRNSSSVSYEKGGGMDDYDGESSALIAAADSASPMEESPMPPAVENGAVPEDMGQRKIIRNASLEIETKDFEDSLTLLEEKTAQYGGYVESSSVQGNSYFSNASRYASYSLRIPSKQFDAFLNDAGGIGNILSKNVSSEEITSQYFDVQARLTSLTLQEERLLEILDKAEELTDVIELEKALSDVRYEIENLTTTLKNYDGLVEYATVQVSLSEVYEITQVQDMPTSLSDRIGQEFSRSLKDVQRNLENLVVAVVGGSPMLIWVLLWAAVLALLILLVIKLSNRASKKAAAKRGVLPQVQGTPPVQYTPGQGYPAKPQEQEESPENRGTEKQ